MTKEKIEEIIRDNVWWSEYRGKIESGGHAEAAAEIFEEIEREKSNGRVGMCSRVAGHDGPCNGYPSSRCQK